MSPSDRLRAIAFRVSLAIVRAAARITPPSMRKEWRAEWEAEVTHRWLDEEDELRGARNKPMPLIRRSAGAFVHAMWLRKRGWSARVLPPGVGRATAHDIRGAVRSMRKNPAFTLIVTCTLALGIGANTAIFSVVHGMLLRPLPYSEPGRLVRILGTIDGTATPPALISYWDFTDWRDRNTVFEQIAAYKWRGLTLPGTPPAHADGAMVTSGFFEVLGVTPTLGRFFGPQDDLQANSQVIVLSYGLWQRRYGGDPSVVGDILTLGDIPYTVIGIGPKEFSDGVLPGVGTHAFWHPMGCEGRAPAASQCPDRGTRYLYVIARLGRRATLEAARSQVATIATSLAGQNQATSARAGADVVPLHEHAVASYRTGMLLLLGAVGFVLVIAVANVASLLLARATERSGEIALRSALGASRARIVGQLLTESVVLAGTGGVIGLGLALMATDTLVAALQSTMPVSARVSAGGTLLMGSIQVDGPVLLFTAVLSVSTGILFGLWPALRATTTDLHSSLKTGASRSTSDASGNRLRNGLVVLQVALSLALLIGASLLINSLWHLSRVDTGVDTNNVLTFRLRPGPPSQPNGTLAYYTDVSARLLAVPGVREVAMADAAPLSGNSITWQARPTGSGISQLVSQVAVEIRRITPNYFRTLGPTIIRGRPFTATDLRDTSQVVIVNETLARRFWPGENPIAKRMAIDDGPSLTVVGLVTNVSHSLSDEIAAPQAYVTYAEAPNSSRTILVKTTAPPEDLVPAIRQIVAVMDPLTPVIDVATLSALVSRASAQPRFRSLLMGAFAAMALALVSIGLYGVLSYAVGQRRREIAIRMALGADQQVVLGLVVRHSLTLVLPGIAIGITAALALTRLFSSFLFEVTTTDPATFLGVPVLMICSALAASYFPAQRATRVDPITSLRSE